MPALHELKRDNLHVYLDKEKDVLTLYRWTEYEHVFCLMNFSASQQFMLPHFNVEDFRILFNSAATDWGGPGDQPDEALGGQPAPATLLLQPESLIIYAGNDYNLVTPAYPGAAVNSNP